MARNLAAGVLTRLGVPDAQREAQVALADRGGYDDDLTSLTTSHDDSLPDSTAALDAYLVEASAFVQDSLAFGGLPVECGAGSTEQLGETPVDEEATHDNDAKVADFDQKLDQDVLDFQDFLTEAHLVQE